MLRDALHYRKEGGGSVDVDKLRSEFSKVDHKDFFSFVHSYDRSIEVSAVCLEKGERVEAHIDDKYVSLYAFDLLEEDKAYTISKFIEVCERVIGKLVEHGRTIFTEDERKVFLPHHLMKGEGSDDV